MSAYLSRPRKRARGLQFSAKNLFVSLAAAAALSGCQTPAVHTQTVEVKVPVAVQPIKPEQVPAVPAPLGPRPASPSAAADMLLAKVCQFVGYALKSDPLLRLSAGEQPKALPKFPECGER